MSLTPSTMLALGTPALGFQLPEVSTQKTVSLKDFEGKTALLVMFISKHCPYVQHVLEGITSLAQDYASASLGIVAVSSNNVETHPDDAPEQLSRMARSEGWRFPVCYDEDQSVAKAFTAACTPDFFLFGPDRKLVYRGQLDDSRPENGKPVTGKDLRGAIDAVLAGQPVSENQMASIGCNIKWKPGNEPEYYK